MLATGEQVKGFICEAIGMQGATDVTDYGGLAKLSGIAGNRVGVDGQRLPQSDQQ